MGRFFKFAAIALGLYFGWQHFAHREAPDPWSARRPTSKSIRPPRCGYCKLAMTYMDKHGIEYLEKNIEISWSCGEFRDRGGRGVPYLFVYGEPMRGFNAGALRTVAFAGLLTARPGGLSALRQPRGWPALRLRRRWP